MRLCPKCKTTKPLREFHKQLANPSGHTSYCKECVSKYGKSRYTYKIQKRLSDNTRLCTSCNQWLSYSEYSPKQAKCDLCKVVKKYNMTRNEWNVLYNQQHGVCAICKRSAKLFVDHDHSCCAGIRSCGKCVRGLICHKCNSALGMFSDSLIILNSAINYLQSD